MFNQISLFFAFFFTLFSLQSFAITEGMVHCGLINGYSGTCYTANSCASWGPNSQPGDQCTPVCKVSASMYGKPGCPTVCHTDTICGPPHGSTHIQKCMSDGTSVLSEVLSGSIMDTCNGHASDPGFDQWPPACPASCLTLTPTPPASVAPCVAATPAPVADCSALASNNYQNKTGIYHYVAGSSLLVTGTCPAPSTVSGLSTIPNSYTQSPINNGCECSCNEASFMSGGLPAGASWGVASGRSGSSPYLVTSSCSGDFDDGQMCAWHASFSCRPVAANVCGTSTTPTPTPASTGLSFVFTPNAFDFGNITIANASNSQNIVIKNTSSINANNCTVSISDTNNFILNIPNTCNNILAQQSCTVTLIGKPSTIATSNANLSISCDAPVQSGFNEHSFKSSLDRLIAEIYLKSEKIFNFIIPKANAFSQSPWSETGCFSYRNNLTSAVSQMCCTNLSTPSLLENTTAPPPSCWYNDINGMPVSMAPNCPQGDIHWITDPDHPNRTYVSHAACICDRYPNSSTATTGLNNCSGFGGNYYSDSTSNSTTSTNTSTPSSTNPQVVFSSGNYTVTGVAPTSCPPVITTGGTFPNCNCADPTQTYNPITNTCSSGSDTSTSTNTTTDSNSDPLHITTDVITIANGVKVCGDGRISVNSNNTVYDKKTSSTSSSKSPYYQSLANSHCVCSYKPYPAPVPLPIANNGQVIAQVLPPDTFSKISSQNNSNKIDYSPVAIAKNSNEGTVDGRLGSLYGKTPVPASVCGCPNLNEKYKPLLENENLAQGASCVSALTGEHQVLMTYNSNVHLSQVINAGNEPVDSNSNIVTKIALPVSIGGVKTLPYTRRIWACSTGYKVVDLTGTPHCEFIAAEHQCSAGTSNDTASAVSSGVSGSSLSAKFNNTINKKLSCCLNAYTKGNQNLKFDCIDNSSAVDTSFDALWASKDVDGDGGQLNAVVLSDSKGKPISGFYTLDGSRCNGFSEFGGELKPRTVNPTRSVTGQVETVDTTSASSVTSLLLPTSDAYNFINSKPSFNKVPTTQEELNRCLILVRAAMKATCGANETIPAVQNTITEGVKTRCTAASKISIHVQVMQLTKIAGMAPMKTFDTVADPKSAASIDIGKIVGSKNSGECADGAKRVGSQCVYQ